MDNSAATVCRRWFGPLLMTHHVLLSLRDSQNSQLAPISPQSRASENLRTIFVRWVWHRVAALMTGGPSASWGTSHHRIRRNVGARSGVLIKRLRKRLDCPDDE